jgi:phosphomannomutase/phosphoglucomutase
MVQLQQRVLAEGADLGIGFDGDADRIGVVDETGRIRWGDEFMALFFREVLPLQPGKPAIVEVKCSQALIDDIVAHGGQPLIYKTGHSLIKAKMKETGALFTGEMSGHMFFADEFFGHDDAIYAGARLMRIIAKSEHRLSELLADLPTYYATRELRVDCDDRNKFNVVAAVAESLGKVYRTIDVDGVRVVFADGWGLVRCSNTSPKLIVRAEGRTPARRNEILAVLRSELAQHPGVDLSQLDAELVR